MAQVRHITESAAVPGLVTTGMEAAPIAREPAASRRELCPALLLIDWVSLLGIRAAVMIKDEIGVNLQPILVRGLDKIEQLNPETEPSRRAALLIEITEVVVIVRIVTHRFPVGRLVRRREPQCCETGARDISEFRFDQAPPLMLAIFPSGAVPVKALQNDTHGQLRGVTMAAPAVLNKAE